MLKPVIISPFGFLEVEMEDVFWNALKLRQMHLGQLPEAFDAIDVGCAKIAFVNLDHAEEGSGLSASQDQWMRSRRAR